MTLKKILKISEAHDSYKLDSYKKKKKKKKVRTYLAVVHGLIFIWPAY